MPAEGIVDCIRRQVEKVAGGEKIEAIGIGFPGIIQNGVVEDSPNFHQAKGYALQAALSSALSGKAAGAQVRLFNDADIRREFSGAAPCVCVFWISSRKKFLKTPARVTRAAPSL